MRIATVMALLGVLVMGGALLYGFAVGNFMEEGSQLLSMPWGIVSLVDLYTGFALFSCWIVYREKSVARSVISVLFVMVLGSFACSLYALIALVTCGGDWRRFWMGRGWGNRATEA